jgi:hypothetical protein
MLPPPAAASVTRFSDFETLVVGWIWPRNRPIAASKTMETFMLDFSAKLADSTKPSI